MDSQYHYTDNKVYDYNNEEMQTARTKAQQINNQHIGMTDAINHCNIMFQFDKTQAEIATSLKQLATAYNANEVLNDINFFADSIYRFCHHKKMQALHKLFKSIGEMHIGLTIIDKYENIEEVDDDDDLSGDLIGAVAVWNRLLQKENNIDEITDTIQQFIADNELYNHDSEVLINNFDYFVNSIYQFCYSQEMQALHELFAKIGDNHIGVVFADYKEEYETADSPELEESIKYANQMFTIGISLEELTKILADLAKDYDSPEILNNLNFFANSLYQFCHNDKAYRLYEMFAEIGMCMGLHPIIRHEEDD